MIMMGHKGIRYGYGMDEYTTQEEALVLILWALIERGGRRCGNRLRTKDQSMPIRHKTGYYIQDTNGGLMCSNVI
jgi:hypothetical protein